MDWFWTAQDWSSFWENFCEHGSQVPCQSVFIQPLDICKVQFFPSKSVWAVTSNTWCWRVDGFLACFQRCPLFLYTQGLTQIIGGLLSQTQAGRFKIAVNNTWSFTTKTVCSRISLCRQQQTAAYPSATSAIISSFGLLVKSAAAQNMAHMGGYKPCNLPHSNIVSH